MTGGLLVRAVGAGIVSLKSGNEINIGLCRFQRYSWFFWQLAVSLRLFSLRKNKQKTEGLPIKGRVKRKNTSPWKNPFFFSWRLFPYSTVLFFHPSRIRYFIFFRLSVSIYWSAPVTHQVQGDCVLCKIFVLYAQCLKHGPWSIQTPENLRCHTVFNWMYYKSYGY